MFRIAKGESPFLSPVFYNEHYSDARGFIHMPFDAGNVSKVYEKGKNAKCVIWLFPYRTYDLVGKLKYWTKHQRGREQIQNIGFTEMIRDDPSLVAKIQYWQIILGCVRRSVTLY